MTSFKCSSCGKKFINNFKNYIFVNNIEFEVCEKCNKKILKKVSKHKEKFKSIFDKFED